eukprot:2290171-Rhodomonas_salina.2
MASASGGSAWYSTTLVWCSGALVLCFWSICAACAGGACVGPRAADEDGPCGVWCHVVRVVICGVRLSVLLDLCRCRRSLSLLALTASFLSRSASSNSFPDWRAPSRACAGRR